MFFEQFLIISLIITILHSEHTLYRNLNQNEETKLDYYKYILYVLYSTMCYLDYFVEDVTPHSLFV